MAAIERAWFSYCPTTPAGRLTVSNYTKLPGGPHACAGTPNNICHIYSAYATATGAMYNYHFPNSNALSSNLILYLNDAVASSPATAQPNTGFKYVNVRQN